MPAAEDGAVPRSTLKEFIASISTISGDLSNITAPPFLLATNSTTELPQYWADHPQLFAAPASSSDPAHRALLVLKWFLGSLRNQQYAGRPEAEGIKKPLNAFLGELFLGNFHGDEGETRLVSEQVSHHPPVTACYLSDASAGVSASGFTCQEITFSGSVHIKQKGYAILKIEKYDESYLIPVPNVKVKGVLSGSPYPELVGKYEIVSTSGYVSEVNFEGKGVLGFGGTKNAVDARIFKAETPKNVLYEVEGAWNESFVIKQGGQEIETFDVRTEPTVAISLPNVDEQDPWESRKAWKGVIEGLKRGDMQAVSDEKNVVEQGQRDMRKAEEQSGKKWHAVFFDRVQEDDELQVFEKIWKTSTVTDEKAGIWRVNLKAIDENKRSYHGDLTPANTTFEQNGHGDTAKTTDHRTPSSSQVQPREVAGVVGGLQDLNISNSQQAMRDHPTSPSDSQPPTQEPVGEPVGEPIEFAKSAYKEQIDKTRLERQQVEDFLRHKYSSAK